MYRTSSQNGRNCVQTRSADGRLNRVIEQLEPRRLLDGGFYPKVDYGTGVYPGSVTSADFNGDAIPDLAVANRNSDTVSVLLNSGNGTFSAKVDYPTGRSPFSVTSGDFNGDTRSDLAVANFAGQTVSVLLNNGDGTFAPKVDYGAASPRCVTSADLNGDGKLDLAVANVGSSGVGVLLNNGNGTFAARVDYATGGYPLSVTSADFNGDGKADLAVVNYGTYPNYADSDVSVLLNNGNGTFAAKVDYATGVGLDWVASGDFNGDGRPDLAIVSDSIKAVGVLMNNGDGTFAARVDYAVDAFPASAISADFNGDGVADLAAAVSGLKDGVSVLLNNSNGTFGASVFYAAGNNPLSVTSGDFNGDGKPDLATANMQGTSVSVLLSKSTFGLASKVDYGTGSDPRSVASGDFNGDSRPDLAVANEGANTVSVLRNNGDGTFAAKVDYATGNGPYSVASADFNGDGKPDLAVANSSSDTVSVLRSNGDGTFAGKVDYATGHGPRAVTAADFNGDGWPDLAVANFFGSTVSILLNKGNGTFANKADLAVVAYPISVTSADFNGDGRPDLAIASGNFATVNVLLNNGNGTFASKVDYATSSGSVSVTSADFNGDGKADLTVANYHTDTVSILLNNGNGTFAAKVDYATGRGPYSLTAADFNGDGKADLGVANRDSNTVSVLLNTGSGTFPTRTNSRSGNTPQSITSADFNGDGNVDLAVANSSDDTVAVLINRRTTVTINQAAIQVDPTNLEVVHFTVVFSHPVTDFTDEDVSLSGTAGATTATVTGSGRTYNVAVSGMSQSGTVIASIAAGVAHDAANNPNTASTSTDNIVMFDNVRPTVTINQAAAQTDPTNSPTVDFTVVFSEPVTGFTAGDITLEGDAGATTAIVTGSGTTYNVAVSGMTQSGAVSARVLADVATDAAGNGNPDATSTDHSARYDNIVPTVTINQASAQADPTSASAINFTVVFSEDVLGFTTGDVVLSGTAGATTAEVTGSGTTYNVAISGMTQPGTVSVSVPAAVAMDAAGNTNPASTSTDNTINFDNLGPTMTIEQAVGQLDPTNGATVNFTIVFSEPVIGFTTGDVALGGTAGATTAIVTGSGTTYNVAVSGMTRSGTVIASIPAGVAADAANNPNAASTSTDNTVTVDCVVPQATLTAATIKSAPRKPPYYFKVTYKDDMALKASTVGAGDIIVYPPKAVKKYKPVATWVPSKKPFGDTKKIITYYSIPAPGGTWDKADNGVYSVVLACKHICDVAGNAIAPKKAGLVVGTFKVQIGAKSAKSTQAHAAASPLGATTVRPVQKKDRDSLLAKLFSTEPVV